jgi:hypothetical protein
LNDTEAQCTKVHVIADIFDFGAVCLLANILLCGKDLLLMKVLQNDKYIAAFIKDRLLRKF